MKRRDHGSGEVPSCADLTPLSRAKLIAQDGFADADGPKVVQRCRSRLDKQRRFRHRFAQLGDSLLGFGYASARFDEFILGIAHFGTPDSAPAAMVDPSMK